MKPATKTETLPEKPKKVFANWGYETETHTLINTVEEEEVILDGRPAKMKTCKQVVFQFLD